MNSKICETIRKRILFLEYQPGQILNEKKLADEFGVSRTPLREIFYRLEWEKLVTITPRAGAIITPVEFQKLRDVFRVRISIEGLIGRLAAERISNGKLEEMREIKAQCESLSPDVDIKQLINIDIKFRELLNNSANNLILKETSDNLYNMTLRAWFMVFDGPDFSVEIDEELKEIEKTIEVLSHRNPQEAEAFKQNVIINYVERIKNKF